MIGSFTETNEFSVLPTNWLIKTVGPDGRSIIYCKWPPPPTTVSSDIINAAVEPEIDWPSFKVRLANNGKEFCKYNCYPYNLHNYKSNIILNVILALYLQLPN